MRYELTKATATKKTNGKTTSKSPKSSTRRGKSPAGKGSKITASKNGNGKVRGHTLDVPGFSVRVRDQKIRKRLETAATKKGVSRTEFMRNAVMVALARSEK